MYELQPLEIGGTVAAAPSMVNPGSLALGADTVAAGQALGTGAAESSSGFLGMGPWGWAMAALTLAKMNQQENAKKASYKLEGKKAQFSPWTNIGPGQTKESDPAGTLIAGGASILGNQASMNTAASQQSLIDAQRRYLDAQSSLVNQGVSPGAIGNSSTKLGMPSPWDSLPSAGNPQVEQGLLYPSFRKEPFGRYGNPLRG